MPLRPPAYAFLYMRFGAIVGGMTPISLEDSGMFKHRVDMLRNIALYHHEAINGRGYPRGLKGDEIPIEARIVSVADMFGALTSKRPYRKAWTNDEAFATLRKMAGTQVDQDCVEALITCRGEIEQIQTKPEEDPCG